MEEKWYDMSEEERIKNVYSKYTIKDFWNWWSGGESKVMEVRIMDFTLVKEISLKYNLPYSASGVFVNNEITLKNVIGSVRDKATVWFGIQPRRKNWNKWGKKGFGGSDIFVDEIGFIFIDIDRITKTTTATNQELKKADELANLLLERFKLEGWNKSYMKICSGNGLQLVIKLDFPIKLIPIEFDSKTKIYSINDEYEKMRTMQRRE